jgi:hypothetical protein
MHSWLAATNNSDLAKNKRENNKLACPDMGPFSLLLQIAFSPTVKSYNGLTPPH